MGLAAKVQSLDRPARGEVQRVDLLAIVRIAITASRVPMKDIAIDLKVDAAYLTKMLSGEKPFPLSKLAQLPTPVFETFRSLLTEFDQRAVGQAFLMLGRAMLRIPRFPERDLDERLNVDLKMKRAELEK